MEHMIQSLVKTMDVDLNRIKTAAYVKKWIVSCLHGTCMLYVHNVLVELDSIIFKHPEFKGLVCFPNYTLSFNQKIVNL